MANQFLPEIFLNSLPQGTAQQKNPLSLLQSKMTSAAIEVFLDIFENEILLENDVDNPLWNPNYSLEKWLGIFKIELAILNNDYSDPTFLKYIVRFYNRLLVHRPIPISISALNKLFDEYKDFGMSIKFDTVFTLGFSVLGGDEYIGLPGSSSTINIDSSAKYFQYYPVIVRLLFRVLPINASLRVQTPFNFGVGIPNYNTFKLVHNCNAPYQATSTELVYATGEFSVNQSPVKPLEDYNILVEKFVTFKLAPFRPIVKSTSLYLSFFVFNITSEVITVVLMVIDPATSQQKKMEYTFTNIALDRWTSVLVEIKDFDTTYDLNTLSLYGDLNSNGTYNKFYIDQVRIHPGEDSVSSNIYIEQEIARKIIK